MSVDSDIMVIRVTEENKKLRNERDDFKNRMLVLEDRVGSLKRTIEEYEANETTDLAERYEQTKRLADDRKKEMHEKDLTIKTLRGELKSANKKLGEFYEKKKIQEIIIELLVEKLGEKK